MEQTPQSGQITKRERKLLFLPFFLFPFLTLLFWAAGGGKDNAASKNPAGAGLNTQLPEAQLQNHTLADKLSFYQQASRDSVKREEEKRNDPFWNRMAFDSSLSGTGTGEEVWSPGTDYNPMPFSQPEENRLEQNEARAYQKMDRLKGLLAQSNPSPRAKEGTDDPGSGNVTYGGRNGKTDAFAQAMNPSGGDPELEQLNTMLDKIAAIQHPDAAPAPGSAGGGSASRSPVKVRSTKGPVLSSPSPRRKEDNPATVPKGKAVFYSDDFLPADTADEEQVTTFSAFIPRMQVATGGSTVQVQLGEAIDVGGTVVAKGTHLYGVAALGNGRLLITIKSVRWGNNVYPVALEVYDMDGLAGICAPGSVTGEVIRQSSGRLANGGVGLTSLDPSLGAQAAGAGLEAAKSLLSRKAKAVKITLPAGYKVLLKDSGIH